MVPARGVRVNPFSRLREKVDGAAGRMRARTEETDMRNDEPLFPRNRALVQCALRQLTRSRRLWHALRDRRIEALNFAGKSPIGPYIVDFFCSRIELVLEADGSQHAESRHDAVRDAWLAREATDSALLESRTFWARSKACWRRSPQRAACHGEARACPHPSPLPQAGEAAQPLIRRFAPPSPASAEKGSSMIRLAPRFAELAATTNFSFLRGASHPEEMVARAAELGLAGIGIADRNTLAGVVRAHVFARENRRRSAPCASSPARGSPSSTARRTCSPIRRIAPLTAGSAGFSRPGNLRAPKGECHLTFEDLHRAWRGAAGRGASRSSPCGLGRGVARTFKRSAVKLKLPSAARPSTPSLPARGEGNGGSPAQSESQS